MYNIVYKELEGQCLFSQLCFVVSAPLVEKGFMGPTSIGRDST